MFKSVLIFVIVGAVSAHMPHYREECKEELNIPQENIDNYSEYIECYNNLWGASSRL